MDKVKAFLASKNITSHTFVVAVLTFFAFYAQDAQFKAFIDGLLVNHPDANKWFSIALLVYAKYSHSSK